MTLSEILTILQNRLISLQEARKNAVNNGMLTQISDIDSDILSTTASIEKIQEVINITGI